MIHQPVRIVCPNCEAEYEIPPEALPATGRDMKCSGCAHAWYQLAQPVRPARRAETPTQPDPEKATSKPAAAARFARPEPEPEVEPEIDDEPLPEMRMPPRRIDPQVLEILQQEAEREVLARKSSTLPARPRPRDIIDPRKDLGNTMRDRLARLQEAERERNGKVQPEPATEAKPDREVFPDISPLRPAEAKPAPPYTRLAPRHEPEVKLPATLSPREIALTVAERERREFRIGFLLPVLLVVGGLALFALAPRIAVTFPAAAPVFDGVHENGLALLTSIDTQIRGAFTALVERLGS